MAPFESHQLPRSKYARLDAPTDDDLEPTPTRFSSESNATLEDLEEHDPLKAKLVELRYFAGLTGDQAAAVLGMSPSAVDRLWVYTRAWLRRELGFGA